MKRKILSILFAALFCATAAGCSAGDLKVTFDNVKPWSSLEKCTYKIERVYVNGDERKTVATGTYTSTLIDSGDESEITNSFSLTYNDEPETLTLDEHGHMMINKNLTDTYTGKAKFDNSSLAPISAQKVLNLAQRPLNDDAGTPVRTDNPADDVAYSLTYASDIKGGYADPRSYSYFADYRENYADYSTTRGSTDGKVRSYRNVEKKIGIENNTRFDNEQLNYVVRALSAVSREGSATFYLSSIHDSYARDTYVRYTMNMNCDKNNASIDLDLPKTTFDKIAFVNTENQELEVAEGANDTSRVSLPCVQASVSISSETPGPPVKFFILDPSITVTSRTGAITTKKLITRMVFTEYAVSSAKLAYETIYTLVDYSNN